MNAEDCGVGNRPHLFLAAILLPVQGDRSPAKGASCQNMTSRGESPSLDDTLPVVTAVDKLPKSCRLEGFGCG